MSATILYTADPNTATGYRQAGFDEIMTAARQALNRRVRRGTGLTSPRVARDFLIARLAELPHEVFTLICLDLCGAIGYVEKRTQSPVIYGKCDRITSHNLSSSSGFAT